jgi:branched-chain amino acid transport system permease protein
MQSAIYVVIYMYWASSWNILGGYTGLFALGNGVYIGVGAYVTAVLFVYCGITPWIGMIIAGLVAGLLSVLIGYPVFKLKGMYYSLASIALMSVFELIFNNEMEIFGVYTGGPNGLRFPVTGRALDMQLSSKTSYYYLVLALLVIVLLFSDYIQNSKTGFYFRSIRANQDAAASLGVNVLKYKLTTFLYVNAKQVFGMDLSFSMVLFCILGGANTLWGPVIGALLMVPIQQALRVAAGVELAALSSLIYGLALCLVMLFMPDGLLGAIKKLIAKRKTATVAPLAAAVTDAGQGGAEDE